MNEEKNAIPYIAHESMMTRLERTIERLWILCIVLVLLLVGTNVAWICYENSFEDVVVTQQLDEGYNNYIGNDGDIYNGESETNSENKAP